MLKMTKAEPFVLLHMGRCGSKVVGDLLSQHPSIKWCNEFFINHSLPGTPDGPTPKHQPLDACESELVTSKTHCGFSIKTWHFEFSGTSLVEYFKRFPTSKCVVLERRNVLRKILSHLIAKKRGVWHQYEDSRNLGMPEQKLTAVAIDVNNVFVRPYQASLIQLIDLCNDEYRKLRETVEKNCMYPLYLDLKYEDHVEKNPQTVYHRICGYLGVSYSTSLVRLKRTNDYPLTQLIENYDEVESVLKGTRHAWMLD